MPVEKIKISGFRGILHPIELDFTNGGGPSSMAIYGRNGTGKSSITDALEWFHKHRIEHLRREGARERSYPHRDADPGDSYVEVHFKDSNLGSIRKTFDHEKVTNLDVDDGFEDFQSKAEHPFYIRFEDLKDFVYKTKSEKYDTLADLMGFKKQVDFQKSLNRVKRRLKDKLDSIDDRRKQRRKDLLKYLSSESTSKNDVLEEINRRLEDHDLKIESLENADEAREELRTRVEDNPELQKISDLKSIVDDLSSVSLGEIKEATGEYQTALSQYSEKEKESVETTLLDLYEKAEDVLSQLEESGRDTSVCPLCDQPYPGNLYSHIQEELEALRGLKKAKQKLESSRKRYLGLLSEAKTAKDNITPEEDLKEFSDVLEEENITKIHNNLNDIKNLSSDLKKNISENLTIEDSTLEKSEKLKDTVGKFNKNKERILESAQKQLNYLQESSERTDLVEDFEWIGNTIDAFKKWDKENEKYKSLLYNHEKYKDIVDNYIEQSMSDVENRFEEISEDVSTFFEVLESDASGIRDPEIKLLRSEDRAVRLKVHFYGEDTEPAYKLLSESQLNSFGLAVFLASAKRFNPDFKFLVLDDVVNSFDAHKRPKVTNLIDNYLPNFQFLVLTHDRVWRKQITERFNTWNLQRFNRWEPNHGPIIDDDQSDIERVKSLLDEDRPGEAGRELAPFLERKFQHLCELFEALVKYNRRNEYTLKPLSTRLRVRVKDKLGETHELTTAIRDLVDSSSFRNFCVHWKKPEIPFTSTEIKEVAERWEDIEKLIRCSSCNNYPHYDGSGGFECWCGDLQIK